MAKLYGNIMRSHAIGILEQVFDDEWIGLTPAEVLLVADDWLDAESEDGCGAKEYARRIGDGNLASYARCLAVGSMKASRLPVAGI